MTLPNTRSLKEQVGALKNLLPFIAMVSRTSPHLTATSLVLRLIRALLPVATLFVDWRRGQRSRARSNNGCKADFSTRWDFS
jgi:hypothetical protein